MPNPKPVFDLDALGAEIKTIVVNGLTDVLGGAQSDIQVYVTEILPQLTVAIAAGDPIQGELEAQLKLVAEINKIRAINEAWQAVRGVLNVAAKAAVMGIQVATGRLPTLPS